MKRRLQVCAMHIAVTAVCLVRGVSPLNRRCLQRWAGIAVRRDGAWRYTYATAAEAARRMGRARRREARRRFGR